MSWGVLGVTSSHKKKYFELIFDTFNISRIFNYKFLAKCLKF